MKTSFLFLGLVGLALGTAQAGNVSLAWDPVPDPDLASYKVFVGSAPESGDQAILNVGTSTSVTITGLADCSMLYVSVKAVDQSGNESLSFSNVVSGFTQPVVSSVAPNQVVQGDESATLTVMGASFTPGMQRADVGFEDPDLRILDVQYDSCNQLTMVVSVGPFLSNPGDPGYNGAGGVVEEVDPAEIGAMGLTLQAPDGLGGFIGGSASSVLTVDLLASRTDADGSGRVDGFDLTLMARAFGSTRGAGSDYDADVDFDGNKTIDGTDLSILAQFFALTF